MKTSKLLHVVLLVGLVLSVCVHGADTPPPAAAPSDEQDAKAAAARAKSDADQDRKAAEWAASLSLNDPAREARITAVIATHLKAVRDWHNDHPFTTVAAGINPRTGERLSDLDRQMIADSALPKSVHEDLMSGLRKDLSEEQVEAILDKYTVGKVAFTIRSWNDSDGLPTATVHAMARTQDGYLWLGTDAGLTRFDGVRFVTFTTNTTPALGDDRISSLLADTNGVLWVGIASGTLARREAGVFSRVVADPRLPGVRINSMTPARGGGLWLATSGRGPGCPRSRAASPPMKMPTREQTRNGSELS